jgi:hypothetical protein
LLTPSQKQIPVNRALHAGQSIRAGQAADCEFDAVAGKLTSGFNFRHISGFNFRHIEAFGNFAKYSRALSRASPRGGWFAFRSLIREQGNLLPGKDHGKTKEA